MQPPPWRLWPLMMASLVLLAGCWRSGGGPPLPELAAERSEAAERAEKLARIGEVMRRDLEAFDTLRDRFVDPPGAFYAAPFPLDLFKQVAMECLNEPWDPERPEVAGAPAAEANDTPPLDCHPSFFERLDAALAERVPQRRDQALGQLELLDELRALRGQLRERLARIPEIVQFHRGWLADARADLRQRRASFERRRTEYRSNEWAALEERFEDYRRDLNALEDQLDQLDAAWPDWQPRLDASVTALYLEVSELEPNASTTRFPD